MYRPINRAFARALTAKSTRLPQYSPRNLTCVRKKTAYNPVSSHSRKLKPAFSHLCKNNYMPLSYEFKQLYFGMRDAITMARHYEREETKMKNTLSRKAAYIGAGAGLVIFAIFGLLPGSLLGGAAGIKFAGLLFTLPLEPGIVSRMIVLASMLVGVVVSGITIVTATSTTGWLLGRVMDASGQQLDSESAVMNQNK
jgi:hypothetical protein